MNTKNKIIGLLIICFIFLTALVSCGNSANPKTATYGKYEDISFYNALTEYCDDMVQELKDDGEDLKYEIKIEDGWKASKNLNVNTLNDDEKAVTYSLEITLKSKYETEKNTMKFFMILDETDNTVRVRGAYMDEDGDWSEELSKSDAEDMIADIYYEY